MLGKADVAALNSGPEGPQRAVLPGRGRRAPQHTARLGTLGGTRMHHKFVVIDFDKPSGRVSMGSYSFSSPADVKNGENLLLIKDRRIAVAYTVEALRIFDHYQFRVLEQTAKKAKTKLELKKPPRAQGETAWWEEAYTDARKIRDRELFA